MPALTCKIIAVYAEATGLEPGQAREVARESLDTGETGCFVSPRTLDRAPRHRRLYDIENQANAALGFTFADGRIPGPKDACADLGVDLDHHKAQSDVNATAECARRPESFAAARPRR